LTLTVGVREGPTLPDVARKRHHRLLRVLQAHSRRDARARPAVRPPASLRQPVRHTAWPASTNIRAGSRNAVSSAMNKRTIYGGIGALSIAIGAIVSMAIENTGPASPAWANWEFLLGSALLLVSAFFVVVVLMVETSEMRRVLLCGPCIGSACVGIGLIYFSTASRPTSWIPIFLAVVAFLGFQVAFILLIVHVRSNASTGADNDKSCGAA
jgi:hypothetical protein